jgi:tetratricopeptide (TPR) repeat protein
LTLFGRIKIDAGGDERRLSPLTAAALARLVLAEGQLVTAAELCRAMWPGRPGRVMRADRVAVQKRISELRRLLDPQHPGEASPVLRTDRGAVTAYRLVIDREMVDIFRFEELAGQARRAAPDAGADLRRRALALWRDRPLLDVEDREFAIEFIRRLQQLHDDLEQAGSDRTMRSPVGPGSSPARTIAVQVPRELPPALRGFAGRADDLARLDDMLSAARQHPVAMPVIALSGMAGVGKTTLAIEWAHQVSSLFPDGQLYVDLRGFGPGPAMEPGEAVRGFLASLGVTHEKMPGQMAAQTGLYRSMLAGRRMLVLLDNASDPGQVRPMLPGSAGCLAVVTSRDSLGGLAAAEGANVLALDVLTKAEAASLLAGRVGTQRLDAEPEAADEIITACVGLPLALAIVAARVSSRQDFPLAAIAAAMRSSGGMLGPLGIADPVTSVEAAISWSYSRLDPGEARMFRLTGLHPGPDFSSAAAASLAGIPESTAVPIIAGLSRANLVTEHLPGRYASHDLLRQYAAELSQKTDNDADRRLAIGGMLDHYLHTADTARRLVLPHWETITLSPPRPGTATEELANDQEALTWLTRERAALQATVRLACSSGFDTYAWQLPWVVGRFYLSQGRWHELAAMQEAALSAAERLDDQYARALCHRELGAVYARLGRSTEARTELCRALSLFEQLGDIARQARTHGDLAYAAEREGHNAEALRHAEAALGFLRRAGDAAGQARALNGVGRYSALQGDHQRALACCRQALNLQRELGDRYGEVDTWDSLGYSHYHLGDHAQSADCYQHAIDLFGEVGDRYNQARTLIRFGDVQHANGDADAGRRTWQDALQILEQLGHPDAEGLRTRLQPR